MTKQSKQITEITGQLRNNNINLKSSQNQLNKKQNTFYVSFPEELAFSFYKNGHSFFLTGPSGSGKTTVIKRLVNTLNDKNVTVCATTGIAVRNLNITQACTIRHWAGLLDGRNTAGQLVRRLYDEDSSKEPTERKNAADVLIIDEIAMFSANMFEKLNVVCSETIKLSKKLAINFRGVAINLLRRFQTISASTK